MMLIMQRHTSRLNPRVLRLLTGREGRGRKKRGEWGVGRDAKGAQGGGNAVGEGLGGAEDSPL